MRAVLSVLVIITGLAALAGCANPSPYPGGFNNHSYHKSATGPDARTIGYAYTPSKNNEVLKDYERAAADMILLLEQENKGLPQEMKFLERTHKSLPYKTMDYALRQELVVRGYAVTNDKSSKAPEFSFSLKAGREAEEKDLSADKDMFDMRLKLQIEPKSSTEISAFYALPDHRTYY
jgi:hypothetical protein